MFMPGVWILWSKKKCYYFSKGKGKYFYTFNHFYFQKEQNSTNLLLWPQIWQNKPAITPKSFNSLDTNSTQGAKRWGFAINIAKKTPILRSLLRNNRRIQMQLLKNCWSKKLRPKWKEMPRWKEATTDGLPYLLTDWFSKTKIIGNCLMKIKRKRSKN